MGIRTQGMAAFPSNLFYHGSLLLSRVHSLSEDSLSEKLDCTCTVVGESFLLSDAFSYVPALSVSLLCMDDEGAVS